MQTVETLNGSTAAGNSAPASARTIARRWLTSRRGLAVTGIAAVVAGLVLGWNWLSAVGIAPIILSLAPCAAMCALGLCLNKMMGGGQVGAHGPTSPSGTPPAAPEAEVDPS